MTAKFMMVLLRPPAEIAKLISVAKEEGKTADVFGGNLFVIVNDGVTLIPITDLAGKSEKDIDALVVERVTADVMSRLAEVSGDAAAPAVAATGAAALGSTATSAPVRHLTEEEIILLEEMEEAASDVP